MLVTFYSDERERVIPEEGEEGEEYVQPKKNSEMKIAQAQANF